MVLKDVRAKVEKTWTTTKKLLAAMSVWGLIFSLVTISRLGAAFCYDDTLVNSSASHERAARSVQQARSPEYWRVLNNSYDRETPKIVPMALAMILRGFGFRIQVLAERASVGGEALKKEWRHLAPGRFVFVPDPEDLHLHLEGGRYVLFFGSSDREILEARKAGVYAVRIRRGDEAVDRGPYRPGRMGEPVVPFSQY
jgi:acid phosphatase class B